LAPGVGDAAFEQPGVELRVAGEPQPRGEQALAYHPDNALAYYEATPQRLLSQARFLHPDLHQLVVELFNNDHSELSERVYDETVITVAE
jgi:hypothetical protein